MKFHHTYKIILALLAIGIVSGCETAFGPEFDSKPMTIRTETKWLTEFETGIKLQKISFKEYAKNGRIIRNQEFTETGTISVTTNYTYDSFNKYESKFIYDATGNIIDTNLSAHLYDVNGNLSTIIYYLDSGDTSLVVHLFYDDNNNVIKRVNMSPDSTLSETNIEYVYNQNGYVIERTTQSSTGTNFSHENLQYPNKNTVTMTSYNALGAIDEVKYFKYDSGGNLEYEKVFDSANTLIRYYTYEYTFH